MIKLANRIVAVVAGVLLILLAQQSWESFAQGKKFTSEDWYGDTKKVLTEHYTGKTVKLRMAIPATRRGLELADGQLIVEAEKNTAPPLAQAGDELTIKSFKVRDNSIELLLNKNGEQPKKRFFSWPKRPRINLRFSRELNFKDMTVDSINHWLAVAMDVSPLGTAGSAPSAANSQTIIASVAEPAPKSTPANSAQAAPSAQITGDLPQTDSGFGEVTVQCSTGQARIYFDDAYSGFAPRTIRLRAGVHSVLVMANGYAAWEQLVLIPGGKTSVIKVDLRH